MQGFTIALLLAIKASPSLFGGLAFFISPPVIAVSSKLAPGLVLIAVLVESGNLMEMTR